MDLGSLTTSWWKCSFKIPSSAAFGAVYRFPDLNPTSRERRSVQANGSYTKYSLVDMLQLTIMLGVALLSSFFRFSFRTLTKAKHPNKRRCFNNGFLQCQASYGVLPTTNLIEARFVRQTTTETSNAQCLFVQCPSYAFHDCAVTTPSG